MKIRLKKYIAAVFIVSLATTSCKKQLDINIDPNNSPVENGTPSLIFPAAVMSTAGRIGGDMAILGGIWGENWTQAALSNQYKNIEDYNLQKTEFNGAYTELFSGALNDYQFVMRKAKETNAWKFFLMGTVMKAYTYQVLVDLYDKVPYTEAFQGVENLQPKFDDGDFIYQSLLNEIDTALSKDYNSGILTDEEEAADIIFGGDMDKWVRFANTLKLKMYLRLINAKPAEAQAGIQKLYSDNASFLNTDDAAIKSFVDEPDQSNPMYEYNIRRLNTTTNLRASNTLLSFLDDNDDERIPFFYTSNVGMNQGDYNNSAAGTAAVVVQTPTDPVYFISLAESYFLQAEARERYFGGAGAEALYDAGVIAAFNQLGLDGSGYVGAGNAYEYPSGTVEQNIEAIITQKWISFFGSHTLEGFFEKNRTGYPKTSAVYSTDPSYVPGQFVASKNNVTGGNLPRRLVYPDIERSRNVNTPAEVSITTGVWWAL